MLATLVAMVCGVAGILVALWCAATRRIRLHGNDPSLGPAQPRLILRGPYAHVRQPALLAILLGFVATVAVTRDPRIVFALGLAAVWLVRRARERERQSLTRFGEAYRRYQQAVPFILPRV